MSSAVDDNQFTGFTLRIFLRPTTALPPPAFGPLALVFYLNEKHPGQILKVDTVDGQTGEGKDKSCLLLNGDGDIVCSDPISCLWKIGSTFESTEMIVGTDDSQKSQIDQLFKSTLSTLSDPNNTKNMSIITDAANRLEEQLISSFSKPYLYGQAISIADWALWGIIKASSTFNALLRRSQHLSLSKWFTDMEALGPTSKAVDYLKEEVKNLAKGRSKAGVASSNFDGGLPGAVKGQVVTRFPPEPSGYLHIGHCKAAILNQHYAKIYDGKFLVRFDDTNPSKEKEEFQDAILEDLNLLGIVGDRISHTSDHFDLIYDHAITIIKAGKAFCDDTEQEAMKAERMARQPSKRRDATVEENLLRFAQMKEGTTDGSRWCLRAKIKYDDLNGTLRDPVIYRCNLLSHHRTGEKWKIYPTYDFACPIVDSIEGVTHALRTNEYRDRNAQYWWMQKALGLRKVAIKDFARVNFVYTLLSKRKLKWFVETGRARGWDDPRFATVRGIRRRGMTIQAMRDFMIGQGDSQQQVNMEWDALWSINKRIIDPIVPRHTAVSNEKRVSALVKGEELVTCVRALPAHKKNTDIGTKKIAFGDTIYIEQDDAQITLMDWGNAIVRSKKYGEDGSITQVELDLNLKGDFKKTKKKIHWLAPESEDFKAQAGPGTQNVVLLDYDYLITKKKIEDDDEIDDYITPVSEFRVEATADGNIQGMKKGDIIQFERKGYYIVDKPLGEDTTLPSGSGKDWMELIRIPDGRAAGIASKATAPVAPKTEASVKKAGKKVAQPASTSKMYEVQPIYNDEIDMKSQVTTKMYSVANVYS
ncbi:glutamyl-tRNA synthetase [Phakopsora pachyrhizi]|uniref:glutamate--tRNA ligase n=1 Tax=Phakopsora pachyrhizi TaxID=170000 RepID=A0AAV0B6P5_PHAPC|nr:glutamyl-tRNA synthetase [Phakopsora pachyrhizi]